jgi:GMP synthase-like glutamine amidotransferase
MKKILFLDNAVADDTYQAARYWKPLLVYPYDMFRAALGEWPSDINDYTHILTTGSSASVLDHADWMQTEAELIRTAVSKGKVILGSCFGHQLIARSMFGPDAVRVRQTPEIGWPDIEIVADDALLGKAGRILNGFVFHYDEVCRLPPDRATVIARSSACDILGFKLKDQAVWGIQPHFEMGIVEGLNYLDRVSGQDVPARQSFFKSSARLPRDPGWIAPLMKAFYDAGPE